MMNQPNGPQSGPPSGPTKIELMTAEQLQNALNSMRHGETLAFAKTEAEQNKQKALATQIETLSDDEQSSINATFRSEATLKGVGTAITNTNMATQLIALISL